jgi:hypothetical protein
MLGFNGGLLGKRRSPSIAYAPGIWLPNEQSIAKRDGAWPPFRVSELSPVLWYDFSDESTVTVESSQITQIADKGSASRNLTKSPTGPAYSVGINGLKCVDWGSSPHSNYLRNTSTTPFVLAEVYIVQDASFGASFPNFNGLIGNALNESLRVYGSGSTLSINGFNSAFVNGSSAAAASISVSTLNLPSLLRFAFSGPSSMAAGLVIGTETVNFSLERGWYGLIGEVVGFSSPLDQNSQISLHNYFVSKWGLTLG